SLGKIPLSLKENHIDLCTFSGHKIHGLNGTGILCVKKGMQVFPLFHGGGQEQKMRSGTENVAGNVTFVKDMRMTCENMTKDAEKLLEVKSLLYDKLQNLDLIELNTPLESAPHIIHFSVPGIKPETLIHALYEEGFVTSTQSACSSKISEKSRVLEACGKKESIVN